MKRLLLATALSLPLALGAAAGARAALSFTDGSFISLTEVVNITFTYLGGSAGNQNLMFGETPGTGVLVFDSATASVGDTFTVTAVGPGTYKLYLDSISGSGTDTWSSDPGENGGDEHLAFTTDFGDFGLGAAPITFDTYYGWEDLPLASSDLDYNDLVFAFTATPVPEPASLALLGLGLLGLGFAARRRRG